MFKKNWRDFHHRLSLRTRLAAIVGVCLVALIAIVGISANALRRQSDAAAAMAHASDMRRAQQDADMYHDALRGDAFAALLRGSDAVLDARTLTAELAEHTHKLRDDLDALAALAADTDLALTLAATRPIAESYINTVSAVVNDAAAGVAVSGARGREVNDAFLRLEAALATQTQQIGHIIDAAKERSEREGGRANQRMLLVTAAFALLVSMLTWGIAYSVRVTIGKVRDAARFIADGNLDTHIDAVRSTDELGQLARAIEHMASKLRDMIGKLRADADRDAFGTQLVEALEMADTETEVHGVVARAMSAVDADRPMELLLADSSRAQLERAAQHERAGAPECSVDSPFSCVAVRRGNPVSFEDSEALNACPRLRGRTCGSISAVCVPVSFMGRALGVLHTTGPVGQLPSTEQIAQLTTLGIQTGARIGTVRAFERTQLQASTDSLTGLSNRRTIEEVVRTLTEASTPFALVMADLDHFKRLNDSSGHEAGDAALRTFSEALRSSVRDKDHPARWGGEEFAVILPGADSAVAAAVVERLRGTLAELLLTSGGSPFTASFGIADTSMSRKFDQLVRIADDALYISKEQGRDRATIGDPLRVQSSVPRRDTEHRAAVDLKAMAAAAG